MLPHAALWQRSWLQRFGHTAAVLPLGMPDRCACSIRQVPHSMFQHMPEWEPLAHSTAAIVGGSSVPLCGKRSCMSVSVDRVILKYTSRWVARLCPSGISVFFVERKQAVSCLSGPTEQQTFTYM